MKKTKNSRAFHKIAAQVKILLTLVLKIHEYYKNSEETIFNHTNSKRIHSFKSISWYWQHATTGSAASNSLTNYLSRRLP